MHRILACVVVLLALTVCTTTARADMPSPAEAMTRVMAVADAAHLSGEIALADADGPMLDRVLGFADRESGEPHRVGARWLWASVTKQVTAVLVMQQVEHGTLSLDGTIRQYLSDFTGATGDEITVRQLLQHVSGLPNPDDTPTDASGQPGLYRETGASIGDAARARTFCAGTPKSRPGTSFSYDNCDYLVLGAILQQVTGRTYADLMADRIATRFALPSIAVAADGVPRGGGAAVGYTDEGRRFPAMNVATFGAAGALTGSAIDLLGFDRALLAGRLLEPGSRATLWTGDPKLGYEALGAWSFPASLRGCGGPLALIERRGDVGGVQVRNVIAPGLRRSIVVFTNDDAIDFGEVWQGKGLSYDLLSAAFCTPGAPPAR